MTQLTVDRSFLDTYNTQPSPTPQGRKDDDSKPPLHLIPWDALEEASKAYALGLKKYGPRNWEAGLAYSRLYRALISHALAWFQKGEEFDNEGNSHLNAIVFNALALRAFTLRNRFDLDDRPNATQGAAQAAVFGGTTKATTPSGMAYQAIS